MFGLGKGKEFVLVAPVTGTVLPLDKVPDEVFSTKMLGDGVAVEPKQQNAETRDGVASIVVSGEKQEVKARVRTADGVVGTAVSGTVVSDGATNGAGKSPDLTVAVAPCDGELSYVAETKHAYVITGEYGVEVMVHIGLDTVNLQGEGFKQLKEQGSKVKAGDTIIEVDMSVLKAHQLPAVTPIVLTDKDQIASLEIQSVTMAEAGKTIVLKGIIKS